MAVVFWGWRRYADEPTAHTSAFFVRECGTTARKRFAVLAGGRAAMYLRRKSVDVCVVHAPLFVIAALIRTVVCCSIYSTISASLLCLDREALPLELSASLLARGARRRSRVNRALWFAAGFVLGSGLLPRPTHPFSLCPSMTVYMTDTTVRTAL